MTDTIGKYINDHSAAGRCVYYHYLGTHDDDAKCTLPQGYCAMNAYLTGLLKLAEAQKASPLLTPPQFLSGFVKNTEGTGGAGMGGTVVWDSKDVKQEAGSNGNVPNGNGGRDV